jgi:hypothetical protein
MVKLKPNTGPGRPTVVTQNAVLRLETAFALGCNVKEALAFAELSKDAYSCHPRSKMNPPTDAKQTHQTGILN